MMMMSNHHVDRFGMMLLLLLVLQMASVDASVFRQGVKEDEERVTFQMETHLQIINRSDVEYLASDLLNGRRAMTNQSILAQEYLIDQLVDMGAEGLNKAQTGRDAFKYRFFNGEGEYLGTNILGFLRGDEIPNEYVVLSAHYDGQGFFCDLKDPDASLACNSASDNAVSVALALGVGRAIVGSGRRPKRSIMFGFWDTEEFGLVGSKAYTNAPLFPLDKIVTVLNYDIQGANFLPSLRNLSFAVAPESGGRRLKTHLAEAVRGEGLDMRSMSAIAGQNRSDYAPFYYQDVPTIFFTDFPGPCYHTNGDDISNLDFHKLETEARISLKLTWRLANTNDPPKFEKPCLLPVNYDDLTTVGNVINSAAEKDIDLFPNQTKILEFQSVINSVTCWGPYLWPFAVACRYDELESLLLDFQEEFSTVDCDGFLEKERRWLELASQGNKAESPLGGIAAIENERYVGHITDEGLEEEPGHKHDNFKSFAFPIGPDHGDSDQTEQDVSAINRRRAQTYFAVDQEEASYASQTRTINLTPYNSGDPDGTTYITKWPVTSADIWCYFDFCGLTSDSPTLLWAIKFENSFESLGDGDDRIQAIDDPSDCRIQIAASSPGSANAYTMLAISSSSGSLNVEDVSYRCLEKGQPSFPEDYLRREWGVKYDDSGFRLNPYDALNAPVTTRVYEFYPQALLGEFVTCAMDECTFSGSPTLQLAIERENSFGDINGDVFVTESTSCPIQLTTQMVQDDYPKVMFAVQSSSSGYVTTGQYFHCQLGEFPTENLNDYSYGDQIVDTKMNLDPYSSSESPQTTRIYKYTGDVDENLPIRCTLSDCVTDGSPTLQLSMKFDGAFTSINDGDDIVTGATCPLTVEATTTFAQAVYVMAIVKSSSGSASQATFQCEDATTPMPTNPLPPPPSNANTPAPFAAPTSAPCACFSETSTVEVQGKGNTLMKDLRVGDSVLVGSDANNKGLYQPVYGFGHLDKTTTTEFVRIYTQSNTKKPLEISAAHLLYVEGKDSAVRADSVQVGDVLIYQTIDAPASSTSVVKLERVFRNGAYMPLTKDGFIVVSGILASSYVSILDEAPKVVKKFLGIVSEERLLHWWLSPYRVVCRMSPSLCAEDYNDEGIAYWLVFGRHLARLADEWGEWSQTFGMILVGLFMATCMVLEFLFGSVLSFVAAFFAFGFSKRVLKSPREKIDREKKVV